MIGTRFFVEATPTSTPVIVFEGLVQVTNIIATVVGQTQVSAGQQALANANQAPTSASSASPASMRAATSQTQVGAGAGAGAAGAMSNIWVLVPAAATGVVTAVIVPTVVDDEPVSPSSPSR